MCQPKPDSSLDVLGKNGPRGRTAAPSKLESLAKIEAAHIGIRNDLSGIALDQHPAGMNNIGAVDQPQGLSYIVVGDENAYTAPFQMLDEQLNVANGDRIDSGKWFIEEHERRTPSQRTGDFAAPPL